MNDDKINFNLSSVMSDVKICPINFLLRQDYFIVIKHESKEEATGYKIIQFV
jgi:hypothetical protein